MIAYIDTSALLRIVLREPGGLDELRSYDALVSSEVIALESARTIDRLRLQGALTTEEAAARLRTVYEWLEAIDLVLVRTPVLSRASEPLPMPSGQLMPSIWRRRLSGATAWRRCKRWRPTIQHSDSPPRHSGSTCVESRRTLRSR
jgi:hypothetical protein